MAYFKIAEPGHAVKYIKEIDRANGTLEFSEDRNGCFQQDSGFFADSEFAYLMFHFKEAYPELQYMTIDTNWYASNEEEQLVGEAVAEPEAPNDDLPWGNVDAVGPEAPRYLGNVGAVAEAPQQIRAPRQINEVVNQVADYQAMGDMQEVFPYNIAAANTMEATEEVNEIPWE